MPAENDEGKRVVILGGGCGAMAAAFSLTNDKDWREKFASITLYQQGWRLGGKGAAGRGVAGRIEEHGLHLWGGFYPNAFHMIRQCYEQLARPPAHPLATWDRAFVASRAFCAEEHLGATWKPWVANFPMRDGLPGDVDPSTGQPYGPPDIPHVMSAAADWLSNRIAHFDVPPQWDGDKERVVTSLRDFSTQVLEDRARLVVPARGFVAFAPTDQWADRIRLLRRQTLSYLDSLKSLGDELRRLRILADVVLTCMIGFFADDVIHEGFDVIDDVGLGEWLTHHGARAQTVDSAIVEGGYDYVFAYPRGDVSKASLSAAVALRGFVRLIFGFRGALFWKMHCGMGDAVFAPLYELLEKRGVKFEFFHCVKSLTLSADESRVQTILVNRQAALEPVAADAPRYAPLTPRAGLDCWPAQPLFDQLANGGEMNQHWNSGDLEGGAASDPKRHLVELRDGRDFDEVILGLPVAELRTVCADLARLPRWKAMLEGMETISTLSCQLWLKTPLTAANWKPPLVDVITNYAQPFNTIANMSHLLADEGTGEAGAKALVYLCGPLSAAATAPGSTQAADNDAVKLMARDWLAASAHQIMPAFALSDLVNFGASASDPFDSQYFRANVCPSEQYVLSTPGTARLRMRSDDSGVANLMLAGDWTRNGWNAGCVEAAVVSGMRAARALLGDATPIPGETD